MYFMEKLLAVGVLTIFLKNVGHFQYFAVINYTVMYIVVSTSLYAFLMVSLVKLLYQYVSIFNIF